MARPVDRRAVLAAVLGLLVFALAWEIIGRRELLGSSWPPLSDVWATLSNPKRWTLLGRALRATAREAAIGYVVGVSAALAVCTLAALVPWARRGVYDFAAIVNALPIIAIGPLLIAFFPRPVTPIVIAALTVFFTTTVSVAAGIERSSDAHQQVASVLGASRWRRFRYIQVPAAMPSVMDGLKLAAPSAVLGALLGEWFGTEVGLGQVLLVSMQNYQIDLLWSAALLGAAVALLAYGTISLAQRRVADRFGGI